MNLFLILTGFKSLATHIVGGEMNYFYLGNNQYRITLTVYRDCFNGIPPFDNPAIIGLYDSNNDLVSVSSVSITSQQSVPNAINSPCLTPPTNVCYEVAQYIFTINLPPSTQGVFTVAYQRCCRNGSVANLVNVQGTGATYMAVITDSAVAAVNSNPIFNQWPPTFICRDAPFTFDHSATDPDGDSLVYELSNPFDGGSMSVPVPNPPSSPPYATVTFQPPYSMMDPLGGVPMQINSVTGILRATPNNNGQYVYGITVKEYRNGVYLGETKRDFQVNVVACPQITVASIYSPTISCGSLEADFTNTSFNAATYSWDFGDPTTTNDTSSLRDPSYVYPDTGDYIATLIAYSGINPLCNDTATGIVHVYPEFLTDFTASNEHCSKRFSFTDISYGHSGNSNYWLWNFGDETWSSSANPVHDYPLPGTYQVTLITSADSSCTDTMVKEVHVLQIPISGFTLALDTCTYALTSYQESAYAASYRWDFGDFHIDYNREPVHHYNRPGTFDIQLIVASDSGCVDTSSQTISIPPLPVADFTYSVPPCDSTVQFVNHSVNASDYLWEFADYETSRLESPLHTFSLSGKLPVRLTAISPYGCRTVLRKEIFFISYKKAAFEAIPDSCSGYIHFLDKTNNAAQLFWDFGDGHTSTEFNPVHRFAEDGEHEVSLIVNSESSCPDSVRLIVKYESPIGERVYIPNSFTPNGDGVNDYFKPSIFRPCEVYEITVFNRWGQIVFEHKNAALVNWDGRYNGEPMPNDVYVYVLKGEGKVVNGIINLMR